MRITCLVHNLAVVLGVACGAIAGDFPGWQTMRIIEQEGYPLILRAADLDGNRRQELVVVNTRQSRLDIYRYLGPEQRQAPQAPDPQRPNDLPMAPEFDREELPLEQLPLDVIIHDLDGDGRPELIILAGPPNRVLIYERNPQGQWRKIRSYDLLPGEIPPGLSALILLRHVRPGVRELLISCADGIQAVQLNDEGLVSWLQPRERRGRMDWWLADLDGDGDLDLIEQSRNPKESIRWYACAREGHLMPAEVLFDRAITGAGLLSGHEGMELLLMDGSTPGLLRRHRLTRGQPSALGDRRTLALEGAAKTAWCGIRLAGQAALAVADPERPRLLVYGLGEEGWQAQRAYPMVSNIIGLAAPPAAADTLLIWAKDAADLQLSRWENGRLTYPRPMPQSADVENRRILGLGVVGSTAWWVQRVENDLHLYRWPKGQAAAERTTFKEVGAKAEKVLWVGETRMLVKDQYARSAKLITVDHDQVQTLEPAHLAKTDIAEFLLLDVEGRPVAARLSEGVLQWLDERMHPLDQLMLPQGQKLIGYVPLARNRGWALQQDGEFLHLLRTDAAGIVQVEQSIRVPGGAGVVADPVLGLMLMDQNRLTRLSEGVPHELSLIDSIDSRVGRLSGVKEATIHRFQVTSVTRSDREELVLFDDRRHQATVMVPTDGTLAPAISWPIFDDQKYPYGYPETPLNREPRAALGVNLDGDESQDLALLCHDRLIIYLAKEQP